MLRRKFSPKIDFRPLLLLFSSTAVFSPWVEPGVDSGILMLEDFLEKKGMPEGVLRGLKRLDLDLPGVETELEIGGGSVEIATVVRLVLLLLVLAVRVLGGIELGRVTSARRLCRRRDAESSPRFARPAMSLLEAAMRRAGPELDC